MRLRQPTAADLDAQWPLWDLLLLHLAPQNRALVEPKLHAIRTATPTPEMTP
jgi:hypothetical protein